MGGWRSEIRVGRKLDVLVKEDVQGSTAIKGWIMGTVANVSDTMLRIEFYNLPFRFDKWISKKSDDLAPAGEKTQQDHDWRKRIFRDGNGTLVDCLKGKGVKFVEATILETRYEQLSNKRVFPTVLIGYRVYRKTG